MDTSLSHRQTIFDTGRPRATLGRATQHHLGLKLGAIYGEIGTSAAPLSFMLSVGELERVLAARRKAEQSVFREGVLEVLPNLRAFAVFLTKNSDRADDLVQGTVLRAFDKRESFEPGTNLQAWLFTILRNSFYSEHRKRTYEVEDGDGQYAARVTTLPDQMDRLHLQDLQSALAKLAPDQREALLLVAAQGLPYQEAAAICGTAVGTIKSRVNRARKRLAELLGHRANDLGDGAWSG